ncbi:hypothetical protein TBLA_0I03530 [Henningerozyma blattae CBS 6284]|uniref:PCI domain-containing protein n=1 Tax=Henningerozyma blattae (strain ATCC 34711 / CBS 6284 / DSM 70876 / NBRC 10599 / NRRL Y-10934 / UCD 77-7) TaxID=1071380 RepID=I2H9F4_HENB6|nr:hypothetical protein TBLA_0I03530 [Tetrapisispora blattae CBS 6284]CCH63006.1 hypothetical protein TBLA_0I03530 [Tetrapisispora blattae CBS 6284]
MMPSLSDLVKSLSIANESKDYISCEKLLGPIKVELIKAGLLIHDMNQSCIEKAERDSTYLNDLNIAKHILEIGALVSIHTLNFESFQNYFSQLRVYYFSNYSKVNESSEKSKLISLNLLIFLSNGDITKFHSELEYLSKIIPNLEEDQLYSYPIKLEKWLMEGAYQRAWDLIESGSKVPEFSIFTDTLGKAIREEIAQNTELGYSELPLSNIKALLFFNSEKDVEGFALERGWNISNGIIKFQNDEISEPTEAKSSNIEKGLNYAINLENIV